MLDGVPSLSASWNAPDDERAVVLSMQAALPSDMISPADAVGDARWQALVDEDVATGGADALENFQFDWDWSGMSVQQKADMLATVALDREMSDFIGKASDAAVKPPVDPGEFAGRIAAARMERARRS